MQALVLGAEQYDPVSLRTFLNLQGVTGPWLGFYSNRQGQEASQRQLVADLIKLNPLRIFCSSQVFKLFGLGEQKAVPIILVECDQHGMIKGCLPAGN